MSKFRPIREDELLLIWPLVEKVGLVRSLERLKAYWRRWPEAFQGSSERLETTVAVVGPWRSHLSMGAIYIFEATPHLEKAFLAHLVELLAGSGYDEVISPPLEKGKSRVFQEFGFSPSQTIEVWGKEIQGKEKSFMSKPSREVEVQEVKLNDLRDLKKVEKSAFDKFWCLDERSLLDVLDNEIGFVAVLNNQVVGYSIGSIRHGVGTLVRLAVRSDCQGRGVGSQLMVTLLEWFGKEGIRSIMVSTQEDNQAAKKLYSKFGFKPLPKKIVIWRHRLSGKT